MINSTKLSFTVIDTHSLKTLGIADTSMYSSAQGFNGATLQVITPFNPNKIVELNYFQNGVTILNSNTLQITNVNRLEDLADLPDGIYTAKISICPYEQFWFEDTWFRIDALQCQYNQALLKLNVVNCENCYNPEKLKILNRVRLYIESIKANTQIDNYKEAQKLYSASKKLLEKLLYCEECFDKGYVNIP